MDKMQFGKRVSELRNNTKMSARDMSLSMGQGNAYINNIENGKNYPSMDSFFYMCETLGVTPAQFFTTESKNPAKVDEIAEALKGLDDERLNLIAGIIKCFK